MAYKYGGTTAFTALVTKVQALVNAVKGTAESALSAAQTASTEAKYYGTCATAAGTTAKVVTCAGFKLVAGAKIAIKFTYANTAGTASLNVNSTGAKNVVWLGDTAVASAWIAAETCLFTYDGTNWVLMKNSAGITDWTGFTGANPIAKGGTGATDAATARSNLGITLANLGAAASSHSHALADCTGTLAVDKGGTGATDAATARTNLGITPANIGAAASSHSHALTDCTGTLTVAKGGTGATTAAAARTNLGITLANLGAAASSHSHALTDCTGTLTVAKGGTGATTAAVARTNLGITLANLGAAASSHSHALTACTGTLTIAKGGTGATTAAAALAALGGATMTLINVSVNTTWSANSSGGYKKTVTASGVLASDVPVVGIVMSSDVSAATLQGKAFANVNRITTAANSITLYAFTTAPTTAFTLQMLIVRKA